MSETRDGWSIGELADEAGISVRALHHYGSIGLLRASRRTDAERRRYSDLDVRRLYETTALRQLGLSLADVADVVDGLQSNLGVVIDHLESSAEVGETLRHIQNDLMDLGADLAQPATEPAGRLTDSHTDWLEARPRKLAEELDDVPLPILPTGGAVSSHLHIARTVCRACGRQQPRSTARLENDRWAP